MTETPPSGDYLRLAHLPVRTLRAVYRRGRAPDLTRLAGWEYRGVNLPGLFALLGMRRFIKGFRLVEGGAVEGYNVAVRGRSLVAPWSERVQPDGSREFARFRVVPAAAGAPAVPHPDALLLDYGALPHPELGLSAPVAARLRDYVVRVRPGSDDLLLGRAYLELGSWSIPVGWFALARLQRVPVA